MEASAQHTRADAKEQPAALPVQNETKDEKARLEQGCEGDDYKEFEQPHLEEAIREINENNEGLYNRNIIPSPLQAPKEPSEDENRIAIAEFQMDSQENQGPR